MKKFFNTAGPVNQAEHYKIDPLHRWNLQEILTLIEQRKYFNLYAPRQTGKTSSLLALAEYLNHEGRYLAVYVNFEVAQAARNDIQAGINAVLDELKNRLAAVLQALAYDAAHIMPQIVAASLATVAENGLNAVLTVLCQLLHKPLVLLIDEIDALVGDTLVSVLRQLRSGYDKRPDLFPSTVLLCGVRDIKDYRIHRSGQDIITGGSAFNIKAKSLRLGNFTQDDIQQLYQQHSQETGQVFTQECLDLVWTYTRGQPWLVNALANEVVYEIPENRDPSVVINADKIREAKERLVLSRQTHLDQLADKLSEDRVRRVVLPLLTGEPVQPEKDDEQYCVDLGLIRLGDRGLVISNDIYQEIIPRELTEAQQRNFLNQFSPDWLKPDGSIDVQILLSMFRDFWRENADIWASHIAGYQEAAPQLVTQAFLQRVANGNGYLSREYAAGRRRTDLMLQWKYQKSGKNVNQKIVMELKVYKEKDNLDKLKQQALTQTAEYARICSCGEAHILIFDRTGKTDWKLKDYNELIEHDGVKLQVWGF